MIHHTDQKILPYSQAQMYELVADVERYPEFLPWCQRAVIHEKNEHRMLAELTIGYKIFQESYLSEITLNPSHEIKVYYEKGPLKHLRNQWYFHALTSKTCQIDFEIELELKSLFLQKALESIFTPIAFQMLNAFDARAKQLYS